MLNLPNRRIRTRMYGGVGGEEPRGFPPIPIEFDFLSRIIASKQSMSSWR
jgi:hypothetical protein